MFCDRIVKVQVSDGDVDLPVTFQYQASICFINNAVNGQEHRSQCHFATLAKTVTFECISMQVLKCQMTSVMDDST